MNTFMVLSKSFIFVLTLSFLTQTFAAPKVFTVNASSSSSKSIIEIGDRLVDFSNFCKSGCKYKIPSVAEIRVLNQADDQYIIWTRVEDRKSFEFFSYVTATLNESGDKFVMVDRSPTDAEGKELEKRYDLKHKPSFSKSKTIWTATNTNGNVTISHDGVHETESRLMKTFYKMVQAGLDKAADEKMKHLE
ncbi:hypothetical protein OAB57_01460 [Bacteriovoracaceae bacterium]|nr:hypothetical protein [Bacteriovoracaceae bacterium]